MEPFVKIELEKISKLADGRIYTGEDAKSLGLVDRLGNFEDAVEWAGQLGGIKGKITTVYPKEKKKPFLQYLTESSFNMITNRLVDSNLSAGYIYNPSIRRRICGR